jgi:chromosome segregation ATPase
MDTYALADLNQQYFELFVSRKFVDDETRATLEKIIQLKGQIAAVNDHITAADRETAEISVDQKRLRENISTLKDTPETKQLIARYVAKAGEQETRLEQLAKEKREALLERNRLQNELSATIRALTFDRKL